MQTISPEALKKRIEDGNTPLLLDVREQWEYDICHLGDSLNIPMSCFLKRIDELDQAAETVVICHHGMRSLQVAQYLENLGFNNVINLEGGVDAWARFVEPGMPQY